MSRFSCGMAAAALALIAVLTVAPAPARANGSVSAFFAGTPRRDFGFVTGYGRGGYGSLLYMRGRRQTYLSGYLPGWHSYLGETLCRIRGLRRLLRRLLSPRLLRFAHLDLAGASALI